MKLDRPLQYRLALDGREPADALTQNDRNVLITTLMGTSRDVHEVARITHCTPYTIERICHRVARENAERLLTRNTAADHSESVPLEVRKSVDNLLPRPRRPVAVTQW